MKQCWRWFGPNDPIAPEDLHQAGVTGIVTALHHIPSGNVWSCEEIEKRQQELARAGFEWSVVESLVVSEEIKTQGPDTARHIANYKESLRNLARCGVTTVCYNFMPVLDWTRTVLRQPQSHGGTAMAFSLVDFAVFDLHILKRPGASQDYSSDLRQDARSHFDTMSDTDRKTLTNTIIAGLPGANEKWTLSDVQARLDLYREISTEKLRSHLIDFLAEVAPLADDLGMKLCCHPDDPPFPLLGLPRIMSTTQDYARVLDAVDLPSNGATLCTGSLGVSSSFDSVEFIQKCGRRIHFAHLRNTRRTGGEETRPDFFEALHLEGDTDMVATVRALMTEEQRRKAEGRADWSIPMRPDHGQELLSDLGGHSLPGYPLIGRMRGLAELRGVMHACGASIT